MSIRKPSYDGKTVVDELGRKIVLRKPSYLDEYDLAKALGKDADNSMCYNLMAPLKYVAAIDDTPLETPQNYAECRAAIKRLGEEGVKVVIEEITKEMPETEKEFVDNVKK